jgi:hypothetical protein
MQRTKAIDTDLLKAQVLRMHEGHVEKHPSDGGQASIVSLVEALDNKLLCSSVASERLGCASVDVAAELVK